MDKVLVLVEGQTEEKFVKIVLRPHFKMHDRCLIPTILTTKENISGPNYVGGISSFRQVIKDLRPLLGDTNARIITTMFDYYGLPGDFPGKKSLPGTNCYENVKHLEEILSNEFQDIRFIPYLQLHEFESLLFSSPETISKTTGAPRSVTRALNEIINTFENPELINDNPATCPSRRIKNLIVNYEKPLHGTLISQEIGLDNIRESCSHFNEWLHKLEVT